MGKLRPRIHKVIQLVKSKSRIEPGILVSRGTGLLPTENFALGVVKGIVQVLPSLWNSPVLGIWQVASSSSSNHLDTVCATHLKFII